MYLSQSNVHYNEGFFRGPPPSSPEHLSSSLADPCQRTEHSDYSSPWWRPLLLGGSGGSRPHTQPVLTGLQGHFFWVLAFSSPQDRGRNWLRYIGGPAQVHTAGKSDSTFPSIHVTGKESIRELGSHPPSLPSPLLLPPGMVEGIKAPFLLALRITHKLPHKDHHHPHPEAHRCAQWAQTSVISQPSLRDSG